MSGRGVALVVACAGLLALGVTRAGEDGSADEVPARVPGPVRLPPAPESVAEHGFEVAFPKLPRFRRPLWIGHPGDGSDRLFLLEQGGRVHVFENRPDVDATSIALDLSDVVLRDNNEEGLLGMAFHPDVAKNGLVFVHYSRGTRRRREGVVARFRMNADRTSIRRASERTVLVQPQPWGNHNGGDLRFGPDGYLYVTFGDGGAGNDPRNVGQDLSSWLGKILRIDVDGRAPYAVPRDNPFVGRRGARPEIWAYGLRNVWRMSFDRVTGRLWAGDVGQMTWEEIDVVERGGNYGWSAREGAHPFRPERGRGPFVEPIVEHGRGEAASITGGFVYRGRKLPGLWGAYLYADYATGNVWALRWDGAKVTEHRLLGRRPGISSFGEDRDGEVLFTCFDGRVYRFVARGEATETAPFPTRLSQTGLFVDTAKLEPHASLVPYDVAVPLWADGGGKRRWIHLPGTTTIEVSDDGSWSFPEGTILVKHFELGRRRLETRLLVRRATAWDGYTYVWNDAGTDADLIDARLERDVGTARRPHLWTFPSRGDCASCHADAAGNVLGFTPEQLGAERLATLARRGLFDRAPAAPKEAFPDWRTASTRDVDAPARDRLARTYLDANCAMCHQPGGPGNAEIDLRASTPLAKTGLVDVEPGHGDLGVRNARLLAPGHPERSILWLRMERTEAGGMPPIGHRLADETAGRLIAEWIRDLGR